VSRYRILEEALADLDAAATWYEEQSEGLGLELTAEFRRRLNAALEAPGTGAPAGRTPGAAIIRRYRFHRFKRYALVMAVIGEIPTVLAVEHSSRKPGYWRDRLM
jgi:plasmid stabilization system protein ParE